MEPRSTLADLQRRFVPPRGLNRSRPREVRFTAGGKVLLVIAIVLFAAALAAGIALQRVALRDAAVGTGGLPLWLPPLITVALAGFGWVCLLPLRAERQLLMEGRPAPAVVLSHHKHHSSHGGTHRSMTYEFPLMTGAVVTGKYATSGKPPAIGSVICVLYDPDRPKRSVPYPLKLVRPGIGLG
jgi:Protein of unknown function (DUF3592)